MFLTSVATVPALVRGAAAAEAWVTFADMSFTAKDGSTTVATGVADDPRHGWYQLAGRHYSTADFTVRDAKSDGRSAFADVVTDIDYYYCMPFAGGKCIPQIRTKTVAIKSSERTSSRWSGSVSATWAPEPYTAVRSQFSICIDIRFAPDKCDRESRKSSASVYNG
ncbi:hypothetical protein ACT17Q_14260 [Cellulomonas sp. CW35]|uniref:hypothetical protein n=1 Tax=Cellulomonas sp. CW35 TaxID=3458249 RepID=UPI0040341A87